MDGKTVYLGASKSMHIVNAKHKKYTNPEKIKVKKSSYKLKKGETASIGASVVKQDKKKKLLPSGHGPMLTYTSSNTKVATVTQKGKIKAKKKGTCYIYAQAVNGLQRKVKVTVK